jgi:2-amino-4-hydroxy-6-hydroxymethyldihydropteridine diphosphokinase
LNSKLTTDHSPLVVVALGSNLGDSRQIIRDAFARLQVFSAAPLRQSSLWQTTPVDCPPGSPAFVNAVAGLVPHPGETPESLLKKLQALEKEFGRAPKKIPNAPRRLDLDLIVFGGETRNSPELVLPHPRAGRRKFVLQPLAEIAPELVFPGGRQTVAERLAALPADETVVRL